MMSMEGQRHNATWTATTTKGVEVIALALLSSIARPTRDTQVERYALPILLRMIDGIDVLTFEVT